MIAARGRGALAARGIAAFLGAVLVLVGVSGMQANESASATTPDAPISGGGSSWAENAVDQWTSNVKSNYQWSVSYSGTGSTQGRSQFCQGTYDYGVSDIPFGIANSNEADSCPGRGYVYMPIVAGGTSIMYNLDIGGKQVTNLRLSGETFAEIFTGVITRWNDPAILADNPQLALPATPIIPVVRSDGSGATAQVTIWMRQMYPQIWDAYCAKVGRPTINGHCGVTSLYPVLPGSAMIAKAGDNGTASYTAQPQNVGTITYVEYSYALNLRFPVAKLLNAAGYYTEPTAGHVAVSLLKAQLNNDASSPNYLTEDLSKVYTSTDPRTYELSSYSYLILPTTSAYNFAPSRGKTLADFGAYLLCEGQQQVDQLGYSALPINLVEDGQQQIQKIPGGDPSIKTIAACNNPTFSTNGTNKLAASDPQPPACDKQGKTQCSSGTGGSKASTPATRNQSASSSSSSGSSSDGSSGSSDGSGSSGGGGVDASSGGVSQSGSVVLANATPQKIPAAAAPVIGLTSFVVIFAGLVLLALTLVPTMLRRRKSKLPPWLQGGGR
jgi:phosphate ABC transporter phosphate-binding protein